MHLHEAVGFTPVGTYRAVGYKLGAWRDVGWWECVLATEDAAPTPPVPVTELATTALWQEAMARGEACLHPYRHKRTAE